jgi:CheY-like chemotaxis protein
MAGDLKLRILVVDDEAEIRDMLAFFMGFWAHEVRSASSGKEALQIAEDFGPHLQALSPVYCPGCLAKHPGVRFGVRIRLLRLAICWTLADLAQRA